MDGSDMDSIETTRIDVHLDASGKMPSDIKTLGEIVTFNWDISKTELLNQQVRTFAVSLET